MFRFLKEGDIRGVQQGIMTIAFACIAHVYFFPKVICPYCGWRGRNFYPAYYFKMFRLNAMCPRCFCMERHRLLFIFLTQRFDIKKIGNIRMLDVAPNSYFREKLLSINSDITYISVDISSPLAQVLGDITLAPFKSDSFDIIICCHVLEHIREDHYAMAELFRIMRNNGIGIFQVPYDESIEETIEYAIPDHSDSEHIRRYSKKAFVKKLKSIGFDVAEDHLYWELEDDVIACYGLTPEILVITKKVEMSSSFQPAL